jgi:c-di-GMP-binding flagellar brake protein YcgR
LNIRDISIGGVGLQSQTISPEILTVGTLLHNAVLDFLKLGNVEVTLLVTSHQTINQGERPTYLYGCRFEQLPRSSEATVQRLVFSLEQLNRK